MENGGLKLLFDEKGHGIMNSSAPRHQGDGAIGKQPIRRNSVRLVRGVLRQLTALGAVAPLVTAPEAEGATQESARRRLARVVHNHQNRAGLLSVFFSRPGQPGRRPG